MKSIRNSLVKRFSLILLITFIFLLSAIAYTNINTSNINLKENELQIRKALIQKGKLLVFNISQVLQVLAEENAFGSIRNLVAETYKQDGDISYVIYMDNNRRIWAHADKNRLDAKLEKLNISDTVLAIWSDKLSFADFRLYQQEDGLGIYEFASPIVMDKERLGTIRFGLSTQAMKQTLQSAKYLSNKNIQQNVSIILGLGFISILASFFATRRMANKITSPLDTLTQASKKIADGNYDYKVSVNVDNELGLLAQGIDNMRIKTKHTLEQILENQQQINEKNVILELTKNELKDLNLHLEEKVLARTAELKAAQEKLIESARAAGVAEVAINVLHNIGNVLNSVNVINQTNYEIIKTSKTSALYKTTQLLSSNSEHMVDYLSKDLRGQKIPELFIRLADALKEENNSLEENTYRMLNSISMMTEIISTQQQYAKTDLLQENVQLSEIVDEAINIQADLIKKHGLQLKRNYARVDDINVEKAKVYQILNNLLVNAIDASQHNNKGSADINLKIYQNQQQIIFEIKDSGVGIKQQNLTKIFNHGFTTKKTGHGFGLHSCANLMSEMHGEIYVHSDGEGKGACFQVIFPTDSKPKKLQ
ncbi:MAG: ATP-binding protein [Pseudomonadota bacterium]